jgi:hypothetical protein
VGDEDVEVPGVTALDPALARIAAAPMKVKRTFGSLLVGDENEIPPPTEAEMPALARPDAEVRREMLKLELEARLAELQADARMLEAEGRPMAVDISPEVVAAALGEPDETLPPPEETPPPPSDDATPTPTPGPPSDDAER